LEATYSSELINQSKTKEGSPEMKDQLHVPEFNPQEPRNEYRSKKEKIWKMESSTRVIINKENIYLEDI